MDMDKPGIEDRRERRQRGMQTLAFVGALAVLVVVLYTASLSQRNRRAQDRLLATAVAQQRAEATAAPGRTAAAVSTATAQVFAALRSTPVPLPGEAISVSNAGRVQQLARWGNGLVFDLAWSPDGQLLAVGSTIGVFLYNPRTQEELRYLEVPWTTQLTGFCWGRCLVFSPDGQTLAFGLSEGAVQLWRVADGTPLRSETFDGFVLQVAFSPQGDLLVAGLDLLAGKVWLWQDRKGIVLQAPMEEAMEEAMREEVPTAAVSPRGDFLAVAARDGRVRLWRVADGMLVRIFDTGQSLGRSALAFSPDGRILAAGSDYGGVFLWQVGDGTLQQKLSENLGGPALVFSPDGQLLAFTDSEATRIYRLPEGENLQTWWRSDYYWALAFSPDGQFLARGRPEGEVEIARVADGTLLPALQGRGPAMGVGVAVSPDGQTVAAGSLDGTTWLWRVGDGVPVRAFPSPGLYPYSTGPAFSPDGSLLALGESDGTVSLWQASDGTFARSLPLPAGTSRMFGSAGAAQSMSFSPNGQVLAAGLNDRRIVVWQVADGTVLRVLGELTSTQTAMEPVAVVFSPDGLGLAARAVSSTVSLWQLSDGRLLRVLEGHTDQVFGLAFSPDGQVLASTGESGAVRLWQVGTGELLRTWNQGKSGGKDVPTVIAFSPDGQILACGTLGSIWLWQVADGTLLKVLEGHKSWVNWLAFSRDGRFLVSGSYDGTVRLWGVAR